MKYITIAQAAKKLGVSVGTIYNYCRFGVLEGRVYKARKRKKWMISLKSIENLLEKAEYK